MAESEDPNSAKGSITTSTAEPRGTFLSALTQLATLGGLSNNVSLLIRGESTTRSGELASMVHASMCAHARSVGAIATSSMFDHSAILALSRMLVDGLTMYAYLRESVEDAVWTLRYKVMELHDVTARIKLVRAWQERVEYDDLRNMRESLVGQIKASVVFQGLGEERKKRLLTGEEMFVEGMRKAARVAGWSEEKFISIYNYFSAHIHSAPMSYWRMRQHRVDYLEPGPMQFGSAAMAIEVAVACLRRVTVRQLMESPKFSPNEGWGEYLTQLREEDSKCDVFQSGVAQP